MPEGGFSTSGPRSASDSICCDPARADASENSAASALSPRMVASDASRSSVRRRGAAGSGGLDIEGLAFQCARLRGRLFRRFLRLDGKVGSQPLCDSALERHGPIALPNEDSRRVRACQLVRIGVVHDNVAVARQRRHWTVTREPKGSWKPDRAVFVGVLQAGIDEHGGRAAVELLLEIFFGDSRNAHGPIVVGPSAQCQPGGRGAFSWRRFD